jgi:hypothetical protein
LVEGGDGSDDAFAIEEDERADSGGYGGEQCAQSDVGQNLGAKGQVFCLGRKAGFQRNPGLAGSGRRTGGDAKGFRPSSLSDLGVFG